MKAIAMMIVTGYCILLIGVLFAVGVKALFEVIANKVIIPLMNFLSGESKDEK